VSPLSSDALFHFTSSRNHLISILRNEFRPHYSLEEYGFAMTGGADEAKIAFPMVCFCDIPLSQTATHTATYGSYALGLRKEWGIQHGIAPVLYSHPKSLVAHTLVEMFNKDLATDQGGAGSSYDRILTHYVRLLAYLKPYQGSFFRHGRAVPNVRFYDEREWRWVPEGMDILRTLPERQYLDAAELMQANAELGDVPPLSFEPSDIRYIVVATEAEILPMIHLLRLIKEKYSADDVDLLCSRIVSAEQIARDY
jgi:hypothetical protein